MENDIPLISIITVNYNNVDNLDKSLRSLMNQTYTRIESVIVDGGSSDGSKDVIEKFASSFCNDERSCKWVSEADQGLYFALNKGIKMATGDIIGCLWDEYTTETVLEDMVKAMCNCNADGVHSDLVYVNADGSIKRLWRMGVGRIVDGWMPGHPTLLLSKRVYDKYGNYDTSFKSAADFDFIVRILKDEDIKLAYVPKVQVRMSYGGLSTSSKSAYLRSIFESHRALVNNGVKYAWIVIIKRILRTFKQF